MVGGQDTTAGSHEQTIALVGSSDKIDPAKLSEINTTAYGRGAMAVGDMRTDTSQAYLTSLQFTDGGTSQNIPGSRPLSPKLESAVDKIEAACNGGTGIGTYMSDLWNAIAPLNEVEFAQVNERFTQKYGTKYASRGAKWDIESELKDELNDFHLARFQRMIAEKKINEVPPQFRTTGESLLKPGSSLKAGEITNVKLADGREFDVYVPRNADSRAPVILAGFGAGRGDMKGVLAGESGLTIDAEKTGSIVVFTYGKLREFDTLIGKDKGVAWNIPDRTNLTAVIDRSFDDRNYIDNVIAEVGKQTKMADKVGMMGFSDGGRFAQAYAADRPDKVAAIVALSGTWVEGDRAPKKGLPIMIAHGDSDGILPYNGGAGSTSEKMEWFARSNVDKSRPYLQAKVWSEASGGDGRIVARTMRDGVEERTYSGSSEVKEYIIKGADHGVHDFKNNGSRFFQWLLGKPDMRQDMVSKGAGFLKGHIVRSMESGVSK